MDYDGITVDPRGLVEDEAPAPPAPGAASPARAGPRVSPRRQPRAARCRVLVVEDEALVAIDLTAQLEGMGFDVIGEASRGEDAVAEAVALVPDLVLMDTRLAGPMDGIEAAGRIHAVLDVPIVFLTAHSDEETFARARAADPVAYVLKPFDRRSLKAAIDLGLFHHQTERKHQQMERWLGATVRSMGDGVVTTDVNGRVRDLNDVAAAITGWLPAEARGRELAEVLPLVDADGCPIEDPICRVLKEGVVLGLAPETSLVTRDGRLVPVQDSAAPIRDDHGAITGAVVIFRDASDQVRVQEQLKRTEDLLRHSHKMEAIGQLAGGVAHDFNNLMTVVMGYSEILRQQNPALASSEELLAIQYAAQRAAQLTRQLLAFGRRQVLRPELLDLNVVLRDIAGMLDRVIGDQVVLVVEDAGRTLPIQADRGQLEQVVLNLATNARDAMPDGGQLTITTSVADVNAFFVGTGAAPASGRHVVIEVSDTGLGMDEETRTRIFEPFFTTKGPGQGTGLGLSTVYGIVEQSGGTIHVYSEPGCGTTFRIHLPMRENGEASAPVPAAPEGELRGSETVAVVEDDAVVRDLLRHALEHMGYRVVAFADAIAALEQLPSVGPIHLFLLDVTMPHMSGIELARRLAAPFPGARILLMSGYAFDAAARGGLGVGVPFLQKPFSLRELASCVRGALDVPVG